ncbi:DUF4396 domain-containing protein [Nevskia sp.]|uniref:DUF4396 domain-containing protein n=1 Tax=Nevskia sp. TaxID=1929292 RepID=UPI0025F4CED6|nr:DUF4396 domain-containing protein [Nevskia sp.]
MSTSIPNAEPAATKACCHGDAAVSSAKVPIHPPVSHFRLTTAATLHCLTGCALGEFIGLAIGVTLGLDQWTTMALATATGFASGYTLGLLPLVRRGSSWAAALRTLWLGETISIAAMELAMNFTDYHVGGVRAPSLVSPMFWAGYAAALPAGFLMAWPVNYWLLKSSIKQPCH